MYWIEIDSRTCSPDVFNREWTLVNSKHLHPPTVEECEPDTVVTKSGNAVRIVPSPEGGYGYDYRFSRTMSAAGLVEVVWRPFEGATVYVLLDYIDTKDDERKQLWLRIHRGEGRPDEKTSLEWAVFCPWVHIGGKWYSVKIKLRRHFEDTIGKFGCKYVGLSAIRVRGKVELAVVRTLRAPKWLSSFARLIG
jgi:hypothetical protein